MALGQPTVSSTMIFHGVLKLESVNLVTVCQGLNRSHNTHIQTHSLIRTMQGRYSYTGLIDEETESQRG